MTPCPGTFQVLEESGNATSTRVMDAADTNHSSRVRLKSRKYRLTCGRKKTGRSMAVEARRAEY